MKRKDIFTPIVIGMLIVVLITAAFLPILPNSTCGRTSYASLLRDVWNTKIKKQPTEPKVDCKK